MGAAATAAAMTFNLVCAGTRTVHTFGNDRSEPYQIVYRIDLDHKRYCEDDCRGEFDISEVAARSITLEEKGDSSIPGRDYSETVISRETGQHYSVASSGRIPDWTYTKLTGQCERQPFTGFPTPKTKF